MRNEEEARERLDFLEQLQEVLEVPMIVLAFLWLALFIVEVTAGLNPFLTVAGYLIWALFVVDYLVQLAIAPSRWRYIATNWLTALALLAPALRTLRLLRILRLTRLQSAASLTRGARLVRVFSTLNRGMRALRATMRRRGLGYVAALTATVVLAGAAGMYAFESRQPETAIDTYGSALWWTAMLITTIGSEYWPQSAEGRVLCLMLSLFAFGVFGYITAALASFFVGRDAEQSVCESSVAQLRAEIAALRQTLQADPTRRK